MPDERPPAGAGAAGAWRVLVSLVAALAIGVVIAQSHNAVALAATRLIEPLGILWVNAIRMTVLPLVVSLLISGIAGAASAASVGRVGGRAFVVFAGLLALSAVFAFLVGPALYSLAPAVAGAGRAALLSGATPPDAAPPLSAWFTTLIPSNPVKAAADGAMLPLVVFGVLVGLAMSRTPEPRRTVLLDMATGVSEVMLVLVRWVIALAPFGVFALVLPTAAKLGAGLVGDVGTYVVVFAGCCLLFVAVLYVVVRVAGGIPVGQFARAALPPQAVAIGSSSSLASLPALIESAERRLRLSPAVMGFVLPLAVGTFKVAAPITWTVGALFVARLAGVSLGTPELLTVALTAMVTSFSTPGVPHGGFLLMVPLLTSLGLPAAGVGVLIAIDAIPDVFATMLNVTGDLVAAGIVARWTSGRMPPSMPTAP